LGSCQPSKIRNRLLFVSGDGNVDENRWFENPVGLTVKN
jgi:hypothetical protein